VHITWSSPPYSRGGGRSRGWRWRWPDETIPLIRAHRGEEVLRISGPVSELLDGGTVEVVVDEGPNANGSEGQILGIAVVPPSRATPPDAPLPDDS